MLIYYNKYQRDSLLPKTAEFQPWLWSHHQESQGLFNFLYFSREWETLRNNLCWARLNVNTDMFLYVLQQTFERRQDYADIVIPKIYELQPQRFLSASAIYYIQKFDFKLWQQQQIIIPNQNLSYFALSSRDILPEQLQHLRSSLDLANIMSSVEIVGYVHKNLENYFLNDIGLNAFWYYINTAVNVYDMREKLSARDLREYWLRALYQLLQRYALELENFDEIFHNNNENVHSNQLNSLLFNAIYSQHYDFGNGTILKLKESKNLEKFLNIVYGWELPDLYAHLSRKNLYSLDYMLNNKTFLYTALHMINQYYDLKNHFEPENKLNFNIPQAQIETVDISKLQTYFQDMDYDASVLLKYQAPKFQQALYARRKILNHLDFSIKLNITALQRESVMLRIFLLSQNAKIQYLLDASHILLQNGSNIILRESNEFSAYSKAHLSYTELYHYTDYAWNQALDYPFDFKSMNCAFPHNLMLPKGSQQGKEFQLYMDLVRISNAEFNTNSFHCDLFRNIPYAYAKDINFTLALNHLRSGPIFLKNIKIYHV